MKLTDITINLTQLTYKDKVELLELLNTKTKHKDWTLKMLEMSNMIYLDYEEEDVFDEGNHFKLSYRLRNKKVVSYKEFKTII